MRRRPARPAAIVAALLALAVVFWFRSTPTPQPAQPSASAPAGSTFAPDETQQIALTLRRIESGGPFPYEKDGATFGNRERLLPQKPAGWYREYTVPTPGARTRGARRIVRGKEGESWYTRDHYRSFIPLETRP